MENLKKHNSPWALLLFLIFMSCGSPQKSSSYSHDEFASMIEEYYSYYCEYPFVIDSLIVFCEKRGDSNATLSFLKKHKKIIRCDYSHPTVLQEEFFVTYKRDTLYEYIGEKHFSYLWNILELYSQDYLVYPKSLEDLICFHKATENCIGEEFNRSILRTLEYLQKYDDQITWISNDELFLMKSGNDTIACRIGPSYATSMCHTENWREKWIYLFYDKQGVYVPDEELTKELKSGLQEIRKGYKLEQFDISEYHILYYTEIEGLQRLCKDDDVALDTEWFFDVKSFLAKFCALHGLGKVVFTSPSFQKQAS